MMLWTMMLLGCGGKESTGAWLEHAGFGWVGANHRLSHYELGTTDDEVFAAMIGGTSTTGIFTPLDAGCEQATCDEFPIADRADVEVRWAKTTTKDAVFGAGSADLLVAAEPSTTTLSIPLPHQAKKGEATALLRGFSFDTKEPLTGGDACYRPQNGWLPKALGLTIQDAMLSVDGMAVEVTVGGHFEAGPTSEHERQCLDAVIDQAQVALRIDVLAVVTTAPITTHPVSQSLQYAYSGLPGAPGEQPDPDFNDRKLGSTAAVVGWGSLAFTFHEEGPTRGAYLRTVAFDVSSLRDQAWGHATNFSPGTQLSGFDYVFEGTALAIDLDAEVTVGTVEETIEDVADDLGAPIELRVGH